jgi:FlaA1/EpsC-like NDP-sugar epimerase
MGSRGSVIPFFLSQKDELPITDVRMTRFMITLEEGVDLVWHALDDMVGGEIYVKKIPSMKITDIALALAPDKRQKIIGIRPGEKLHEQMIGAEDSIRTFDFGDHYRILPTIDVGQDVLGGKGKLVAPGFTYTSDNNTDWMSVEQLSTWIEANRARIGTI